MKPIEYEALKMSEEEDEDTTFWVVMWILAGIIGTVLMWVFVAFNAGRFS